MADFVRIASYFKMAALDKAGEGARALSGLRDAGVNLLAFSVFPRNRRAQLDFVPADPMAFKAAAKQAKRKVAEATYNINAGRDGGPGIGEELFKMIGGSRVIRPDSTAHDDGPWAYEGAILW